MSPPASPYIVGCPDLLVPFAARGEGPRENLKGRSRANAYLSGRRISRPGCDAKSLDSVSEPSGEVCSLQTSW